MKRQQKITIGQSNIVSLRYPKVKIKNIKNFGKSYVNTMHKAVLGKKLTNNQCAQLVMIHLIAEDFPVVPNSINLQLIDAYEERLMYCEQKEYFENASEFRDIIISLRDSLK